MTAHVLDHEFDSLGEWALEDAQGHVIPLAGSAAMIPQWTRRGRDVIDVTVLSMPPGFEKIILFLEKIATGLSYPGAVVSLASATMEFGSASPDHPQTLSVGYQSSLLNDSASPCLP